MITPLTSDVVHISLELAKLRPHNSGHEKTIEMTTEFPKRGTSLVIMRRKCSLKTLQKHKPYRSCISNFRRLLLLGMLLSFSDDF